jgi:hypothetical protein
MMTDVRFALACTLAFALGGAPARAAEAIADPICPSAVPRLVALEDAGRSSDAKNMEKAAHAVVDAYTACYNNQKFNGRANPALQQEWMNYDQTRIGQYLVIVGRTQAAQGKTAEAAASYKDAQSHVLDVIGWAPMAQTIHGSSSGSANSERTSDKNHSRWYETAVAVRDAASEELAKVAPAAPGQPTPKP